MSIKRVNELAALLACRVVKTRWPVSAASIDDSAVSGSRVSPIRITSGSCRRKVRRSWANVRPLARITGNCWMLPPRSYSIGSSAVTILSSPLSFSRSADASVVDLPDPVGPETIIMPLASLMIERKSFLTVSFVMCYLLPKNNFIHFLKCKALYWIL